MSVYLFIDHIDLLAQHLDLLLNLARAALHFLEHSVAGRRLDVEESEIVLISLEFLTLAVKVAEKTLAFTSQLAVIATMASI